MKHPIDCEIETIPSPREEAWIISLAEKDVSDLAILISALIHGKLPQFKLVDKAKTALIRTTPGGYILALDDTQINVTAIWLEAVLGMLLDVCLNGWSATAHLDQDFGPVSICLTILPPKS